MLIAQRPTLSEEVVSEHRSRFIIEPLEPGFGRCFREVFEAVQGKFWTPYEESFGHCSRQVLDAV